MGPVKSDGFNPVYGVNISRHLTSQVALSAGFMSGSMESGDVDVNFQGFSIDVLYHILQLKKAAMYVKAGFGFLGYDGSKTIGGELQMDGNISTFEEETYEQAMFEDGTIINELFIERLNYFIYVILLLIGLHGMIAKNNLIKKLIGMSIFQTAIILFYVSVGVKEGATIPIYLPEHDPHGSHASHSDGNETEQSNHGPVVLDAELVKGYSNPLPHVLILTAIVVGIATTSLGLALIIRIREEYHTIEEDQIAEVENAVLKSEQWASEQAAGEHS